jgi:hypothetical protein
MARCQRCGGALLHEDERCLCGGRSESWPEQQLRQMPDCPMCEVPEARSMPPAQTWEECFDQLMSRYVPPE